MQRFHKETIELVKAALAEDVGCGDLTSLACLTPNPLNARIVAKSDGVLSGLQPFCLVFHIVDSANTLRPLKTDGDKFTTGETIVEIDGFNQTLLASERVALNFLAHLSGIATMTSQFVEKVAGTNCKILDTRKTTPGYRYLEKQAVLHGGGSNHRMGLYDMILVKDNHIDSAGSIKEAVLMAKEYLKTPEFRLQFDCKAEDVLIEVEVTTVDQLEEAIVAGADRLLLDNQSPDSLREMVTLSKRIAPTVMLEASGNVSLGTVAGIAATGVDFISVGAITHSAPVCDFSMRVMD